LFEAVIYFPGGKTESAAADRAKPASSDQLYVEKGLFVPHFKTTVIIQEGSAPAMTIKRAPTFGCFSCLPQAMAMSIDLRANAD
jgi:hypothetical protein